MDGLYTHLYLTDLADIKNDPDIDRCRQGPGLFRLRVSLLLIFLPFFGVVVGGLALLPVILSDIIR